MKNDELHRAMYDWLFAPEKPIVPLSSLRQVAPPPTTPSYKYAPVEPTVPLSTLRALTPPPTMTPFEYAPVEPRTSLPTIGSGLRLPTPTPARIPTLGGGLSSLSSLLPAPPSVPSWLRFCDRSFSDPVRFGGWPPLHPGIYAIMILETWPVPVYRPIYFGKAANLSSRVTETHEKFGEWCRVAGGAGNLYVAFHAMPGTTEEQRRAIEEELIKCYTPQCNDQLNPLAGIFGF